MPNSDTNPSVLDYELYLNFQSSDSPVKRSKILLFTTILCDTIPVVPAD